MQVFFMSYQFGESVKFMVKRPASPPTLKKKSFTQRLIKRTKSRNRSAK